MKWSKKLCSYVMTCSILLGAFVPVQPVHAANGPMGIGNHWAQPYLQRMYAYGIMRGDQNKNMRPNDPITRAEFVSSLNRAFGYTELSNVKLPFSDIKGTEWYADDISIAHNQGYFAGMSPKSAGPRHGLTREQAVTLMCRNLKIEQPLGGEVLGYRDSRAFSQWSKGSIGAFSQKGFVSGYADNTFRPAARIARGEVAKILSDVVGYRMSQAGVYQPGMIQGNAMITTSGVSLENTTVTGDLYITAGVGMGYANLRNVTVLGDVIISGGGASEAGQNSINFIGCNINRLIIDGQKDKVVAVDSYGNTIIRKTIVKTNAYLENYGNSNQGFIDIDFLGDKESKLSVSGEFDKITVKNPKTYLTVGKGNVNHVIVDENAAESIVTIDRNASASQLSLDAGCIVKGSGDIGHLIVSAPSTDTAIRPDEITIRPGITAVVGGVEMNSSDAAEYSAKPHILSGYPKPEEISSETVSMIYQTNKSGTLYWAVTLEEDQGKLDEEDIMEPKKSKHAQDILTYGNSPVKEAETDIKSAISKLSPEMEYTVASVLVDVRDKISDVKEKDFETVDTSIPAFSKGYPIVSSDSSNGLEIAVLPTKTCTIYWAVYQTGSKAPTPLELRKGKLTGALVYGSDAGKKNVEDIIDDATSSKMEENTKYDVYVMASDGVRDSQVIKLIGTTKDKTPPKFIEGYPKEDKQEKTAVATRLKVDEDSTVFYVVCKKGSQFPVPQGDAEPPALDSDEGKQAIISGNHVLRSGNTKVKADTELLFKITGLEEETPYDVYMVARDASGNISDVHKLGIKTLDVKPPTAALVLGDELNGNLKMGADLTIQFSEMVINRNTKKQFTLEGLQEATSSDRACIELYNISGGDKKLVPMDLSQAGSVETGTDENAKTYITFHHTDKYLQSGEKYQFVLSGIADTSGNAMEDKTELSFETVPPTVKLNKTVSPIDMDLTFMVTPEEHSTDPNVLYDMILSSDITIKFDLYIKENNAFKPIAKDILIWKNEIASVHQSIHKEQAANMVQESFSSFQEPREYGIKITEVDGDVHRGGWNKTIHIAPDCLIGEKNALNLLAQDSKDGFDKAIESGAKQVNDPTGFTMMLSFTDSIIPQFAEYKYKEGDIEPSKKVYYPITEALDPLGKPVPNGSFIGDTLVKPHVKTDKPAMMYYLIAPAGTVGKVTAEDLIGNRIKVDGAKSGSYRIESGDVEYSFLVDGLQPQRAYDFFYCLKGNPQTPSPVGKKRFQTRAIIPPDLDATAISRGDQTVTMRVRSDKNASVDWIVIPKAECDAWFDASGKLIKNKDEVIQIIRNGQENEEVTTQAYGNVQTMPDDRDKQRPFSADIEVKGLEYGSHYTFLAVARACLDNTGQTIGGFSDVVVERDITPKDTTPPTVTGNTVIENPTATGQPYQGKLTLTFSEEMYYQEGNQLQPLTVDVFRKYLKATNEEDITVNGKPIGINIVGYTTRLYDDVYRDNPVVGLSSITISFQKIYHESVINLDLNLFDKSYNLAGMLYMVFQDNEIYGGNPGEGRRDSKWNIEWRKQ